MFEHLNDENPTRAQKVMWLIEGAEDAETQISQLVNRICLIIDMGAHDSSGSPLTLLGSNVDRCQYLILPFWKNLHDTLQ